MVAGAGTSQNDGMRILFIDGWYGPDPGDWQELWLRSLPDAARVEQDDWETPDTQVIAWDFPAGKSMSWEGRSCNDYPVEGLERGVMI